jgi:tetratricopeptide (TPR) repeat protein
LIYGKTGRYEKAIADCQKALQLAPDNITARIILADIYVLQRKLNSAEVLLKEALGIDPAYALVHYTLGRTYHKMGRQDEAIKECLQAVRIDPASALFYVGLGGVYRDYRMYDQALAALLKAIEFDAHFIEAYRRLGESCMAKGQYEEAIQAFEKALTVKPIPFVYGVKRVQEIRSE